jgi:hypothetical protein
MKKGSSLKIDLTSLKGLKKYLKPFEAIGSKHYFIVSMILLLTLSGVVYFVTGKVNTVVDETATEQPIATTISFDTKTIEALDKLQSSNSSAVYIPPAGRTNPFSE